MSKAIKEPSTIVFEADGLEYSFVVGKFQLRLTNGLPDQFGMLKEVTAEEAVESEAILAHLVSIKAGVIVGKEVKPKKKAK